MAVLITASGPNALVLHYAGDARQLVDGDLLLVDIGATSNQHCADVTRTYPVSGRFIEDTFLATRAGLECLSCASPKGTSEIERRP